MIGLKQPMREKMNSPDTIRLRIDQLLSEVHSIVRVDSSDCLVDSVAVGACSGWIAAAVNIVKIACSSDPQSAYVRHAEMLQTKGNKSEYLIHRDVLGLAGLLRQLRADVDLGLLNALDRRISAEAYDELIDHAQSYLDDGRKEPAGAIVAVVFEDALRRICRTSGVEDTGKTAEPLINALLSKGVLSKLEAKEAKAAADLRANATHALWDNFNSDQVGAVIQFTRRLLRDKLAPR